MKWLIAFHVISMVCWFSGLFYLPRLFIYHVDTQELAGQARFKIMEHKLYYYITMPAAILTTLFGLSLWLPHYAHYAHMNWLHAKLILVLILWGYHLLCGYYVHCFKYDKNTHSGKFFRIFNEIPTIILIAVIILSFVKP